MASSEHSSGPETPRRPVRAAFPLVVVALLGFGSSSAALGQQAAVAPPARDTTPASEGIALIGTAWTFMDASGASFTARFMGDGTFQGPSDMRLWRWEVTPAGLRIVFDNGMGTRIVRDGRFVDAEWLNGEARTADGRRWAWVAHRAEEGAPPVRRR